MQVTTFAESAATDWASPAGGVIFALVILAAIVWRFFRAVAGSRATGSSGPANTTWQQAERAAAAHMRAIGFRDAQLTVSGADGGLDVVSRTAVAQVKALGSPVGRPDVQRLRGASLGRTAVFYATNGYTEAAVRWASEAGVALFTMRSATSIVPVNRAARGVQVANVQIKREMPPTA